MIATMSALGEIYLVDVKNQLSSVYFILLNSAPGLTFPHSLKHVCFVFSEVT